MKISNAVGVMKLVVMIIGLMLGVILAAAGQVINALVFADTIGLILVASFLFVHIWKGDEKSEDKESEKGES